jgi:uncharacterized protein (UPF0335 family)
MESMMPDNEKLKQFVAQIEAAEEELAPILDHIGALYQAAKDEGYDTKVLRKVISRRRKDRRQVAEEDTILDLYEAALG